MKKVISVTLALLLLVLTALPVFADAAVRIVLADNGKTEYRIVISANAAHMQANSTGFRLQMTR